MLIHHDSQVVSSQSVEMLSTESFIRGYHAYKDIWTPVEDEMLRLIPEPTNSVDRNVAYRKHHFYNFWGIYSGIYRIYNFLSVYGI